MVETLIEGYLADEFGRRRMERQIRRCADHVVLCGWGRVGRSIARYLRTSNADVVVVDSAGRADRHRGRAGSVRRRHRRGGAAGGRHRPGRVLITALNGDADNLYVTLTGRSMRPDLFIVSRIASEAAAPSSSRPGANRVVNPQDLGGARMAALAVSPTSPSSWTWSCTMAASNSASSRSMSRRLVAGRSDSAQRPGPCPQRRPGAGPAPSGTGVPDQPAARGGDRRGRCARGHRQPGADRVAPLTGLEPGGPGPSLRLRVECRR